jgi:hypothetical protein
MTTPTFPEIAAACSDHFDLSVAAVEAGLLDTGTPA